MSDPRKPGESRGFTADPVADVTPTFFNSQDVWDAVAPRTLEARWHALVEAGKAQWMPGMAGLEDVPVGTGMHPEGVFRVDEFPYVPHSAAPVFTDPATKGCLLALVRERYADPLAFLASDDPEHLTTPAQTVSWMATLRGGVSPIRHFRGTTEAEALIAALEAS